MAERIAKTLREVGRSESRRALKWAVIAVDCLSMIVDPPGTVRSA